MRLPLGLAGLAVLAAGVAMIPTLRSGGWNVSALAHVNAATGLSAAARTMDPGFRTVHTGAYDGQFYWGIAVHPLPSGHVDRLFDKASYRYGHPLYGWLAWLLSGGRPRAAAAALVIVSLVSLLAGAFLASVLGRARGGSGWEGLFVALNPGLIIAAANDLAEPLAALLMLAAFTALARGRVWVAWVVLALLPLAKEPLVLVVLGVALCELLRRRPARSLSFAAAAIPALCWWIYLRIHLGQWFTSGASALGTPFAGWNAALLEGKLRPPAGGSAIAIAALVALLALLVFSAVRALGSAGAVELSYLALAIVACCLAANATIAFSTALRNTSLLLVLVPFVLSRASRAAAPRPDARFRPPRRRAARS